MAACKAHKKRVVGKRIFLCAEFFCDVGLTSLGNGFLAVCWLLVLVASCRGAKWPSSVVLLYVCLRLLSRRLWCRPRGMSSPPTPRGSSSQSSRLDSLSVVLDIVFHSTVDVRTIEVKKAAAAMGRGAGAGARDYHCNASWLERCARLTEVLQAVPDVPLMYY